MVKTYNHSVEIVRVHCKATLKTLKMEVDSVNKKSGIIKASTRPTFLSWGEKIKISIKEAGINKTKVTVHSTSDQLITWGTNSDNERSIIDTLTKRLNK
jgi:hypothetical protein